ncbi:sigma-70 family RNA polymerase sigma factor [Streptomyces sp. NPDC056165]|uniref:sigma-70 family RNA polymerase sigma factor n=1 Tax=Streptomyces sp. NPDC056165 TaxID=3345733 RepID=UPI0035DAD039
MEHTLPEPFAALAGLEAEPTIEQARALTAALKAVPDLQRWLRVQRQKTVRGLLDTGRDRDELAPHLEVTPQRVSDIASGHTRSKAPRKTA